MVELNANNIIIGKDGNLSKAWEKLLMDALNNNPFGQIYIPVINKAMVGCFIIMFVKEEHKDSIR